MTYFEFFELVNELDLAVDEINDETAKLCQEGHKTIYNRCYFV